MTTIESLEKPGSTRVATALMPKLLALFARWRKARRAARLARVERIISQGLSAIE